MNLWKILINFVLVLPTYQPDKKLSGDAQPEEFQSKEEATRRLRNSLYAYSLVLFSENAWRTSRQTIQVRM